MKKNLSKVALALIFIFILFLGIKFTETYNLKQKGNKLINKVEFFKKINKRLPNSIYEMEPDNQEMGIGPYYKKTDNKYEVFFNIGFDEQLMYYSDTKEWANKP